MIFGCNTMDFFETQYKLVKCVCDYVTASVKIEEIKSIDFFSE